MKETILTLDAPAKERLIAGIRQLPAGKYAVKIARHRERRSGQQNAYYWGVVLPTVAQGIGEAWGESMTADECHEFLKIRFLRRPIINRETNERQGYTVPTTPKLDTKEFSDFLEKIFEFAAAYLAVVIPEASYSGGAVPEARQRSARTVVQN